MTSNLIEFLVSLSTDPRVHASFILNPSKCLEAAGLSKRDQALLVGIDQWAIELRLVEGTLAGRSSKRTASHAADGTGRGG